MKNTNIVALLAFFLIAAGSFHFFNSQIQDTEIDAATAEDFEMNIQNVETIPASESVAYGKGYRLNASISLSKDAGAALVKYRTRRGTVAGGPTALYDYRFVEPGEEFEATLEQNHEEGERQEAEISFINVRDNVSRTGFEEVELHRVFMSTAEYRSYVTGNVSITSFEFSPE